eukprot:6368476-Pyramimonas_sp.AAC.1
MSDSDVGSDAGAGPSAAAKKSKKVSRDDKFRPMGTINERYPGLQGAALLDQVLDDFAVPGYRNINGVKFFTEGGQKTMEPHPLNKRRQDSVVRDYADGVKIDGAVQGVRGEPWALFSPGGKLPYLM